MTTLFFIFTCHISYINFCTNLYFLNLYLSHKLYQLLLHHVFKKNLLVILVFIPTFEPPCIFLIFTCHISFTNLWHVYGNKVYNIADMLIWRFSGRNVNLAFLCRYVILCFYAVPPMPKGDHVLNFSDAEDMINEEELRSVQ